MSRSCLTIVALIATGCAHQTDCEPCRVAVMPVEVQDAPADHGRVLQASVAIELDASPEHGVIEGEEINRALTDRSEDLSACLDSDTCLAAVGELSAADEVLAVRLAGHGDTHVVSVRRVNVAEGVTIQDVEETVLGERRALAVLAPQLLRRMYPAPETPWYENWWVWSAAAAVVGASAFAAAMVMSGSNDVVNLGEL